MGDFHEPDLTTTPRLHLRSMDDAGTLYGTANNAGDIDCGCGVVFKLTAKGKQTAQNTTVKVSINGKDMGTFTGVNSITVYALDGNDSVHLVGIMGQNTLAALGNVWSGRLAGPAG